MKSSSEFGINIPLIWFILPAYLTLWTVVFSLYSLFDGNGMMMNFGIETGGASDFIMLNSAGRYFALAVVMILGIWIFRSYYSILVALTGRFVMDILDLLIGLNTHVIQDISGVIQSILMFLLPALISIFWIIQIKIKTVSQ